MALLESSVDTEAEGFKANAAAYSDLLATLRARQAWALAGGGERMMKRHRQRGKIPARDRIDIGPADAARTLPACGCSVGMVSAGTGGDDSASAHRADGAIPEGSRIA